MGKGTYFQIVPLDDPASVERVSIHHMCHITTFPKLMFDYQFTFVLCNISWVVRGM